MTADRPATGVRPPPGCTVGRAERTASFIILLILAVISLGIFIRQSTFNPAVLVAREAIPTVAAPAPVATAGLIPPQLQLLGASESFNADNLYDKIDGKAELYLAAGFARMHCQRFSLKDAPDQWFEWFVYEMTSLPSAFSVFGTQRRAEGQPLALTEYAYRTANAVYFVCGSNYVEVVASDASAPLLNGALAMASAFVAEAPSVRTHLAELDLFPSVDLVPGSQTLQIADAFGFDGLKNVFTARYQAGAAEFTAFLTACANPAEAQRLRDAYAAFLLGNGGKEQAGGNGLERRIEIMGGVELIFNEGNFVAGIHGATAVTPAEVIAKRLREKLAAHVAAEPRN